MPATFMTLASPDTYANWYVAGMSETTSVPDALPPGWLRLDRAGWWGTFAATPVNGLLVAILPINLGSTYSNILNMLRKSCADRRLPCRRRPMTRHRC